MVYLQFVFYGGFRSQRYNGDILLAQACNLCITYFDRWNQATENKTYGFSSMLFIRRSMKNGIKDRNRKFTEERRNHNRNSRLFINVKMQGIWKSGYILCRPRQGLESKHFFPFRWEPIQR